MRPTTQPQIDQVRELLAPKKRAVGRGRADSAVAARWLRALRSRAAPGSAPRGTSR
jgi:hypothetical protein